MGEWEKFATRLQSARQSAHVAQEQSAKRQRKLDTEAKQHWLGLKNVLAEACKEINATNSDALLTLSQREAHFEIALSMPGEKQLRRVCLQYDYLTKRVTVDQEGCVSGSNGGQPFVTNAYTIVLDENDSFIWREESAERDVPNQVLAEQLLSALIP
jgi:hypothetical protein